MKANCDVEPEVECCMAYDLPLGSGCTGLITIDKVMSTTTNLESKQATNMQKKLHTCRTKRKF